MKTRRFALLGFFALCIPILARADDKAAPPPQAAAKAPIERLAAWPKPESKETIQKDIERVVRANVPEMATQGADALVAAGAAAVPLVLDRYGRERDEEARIRLFDVLVAATKAEHTRLLAKEFESKLAPVRSFALWRVAAFPDPGVRAQADAAWARVAKLGDKADADERYATALCAASTGSIAGLEVLFDACKEAKQWDKKKRELRAALEGARGEDATKIALAKLENADRKQKVAVLRALAGCGAKSCIGRVKSFLDDEDNQIRVAAINALRGIFDGDPPLEDLSAFEAIETAKKWKSRS